MTNESLSREPTRSLRRRALLGTAAALMVGGVIAGQAVFFPQSPAYADAVKVEGVQPVSFSSA